MPLEAPMGVFKRAINLQSLCLEEDPAYDPPSEPIEKYLQALKNTSQPPPLTSLRITCFEFGSVLMDRALDELYECLAGGIGQNLKKLSFDSWKHYRYEELQTILAACPSLTEFNMHTKPVPIHESLSDNESKQFFNLLPASIEKVCVEGDVLEAFIEENEKKEQKELPNLHTLLMPSPELPLLELLKRCQLGFSYIKKLGINPIHCSVTSFFSG